MAGDAQGAKAAGGDIVRLLEAALAPVEPPAALGDQLEDTLAQVQAAALEELSDWELAAMRDPRNWVRPAAAVAVGTAAGAALVVLRMRRAQRQRSGLPGLADRRGERSPARSPAPARACARRAHGPGIRTGRARGAGRNRLCAACAPVLGGDP